MKNVGQAIWAALWMLCGFLAALIWLRQRPDSPQGAHPVSRAAVAVEVSAEKRGEKPPEPEKDAATRLRGMLEMLPLNERRRSLEALGQSLAAKDPHAALDLAATIGNTDDRTMFLRGLFKAWAVIDPGAAVAAANAQLTGSIRNTCLSAACGGWAGRDPNAAGSWAFAQLNGPTRTQALAAVAETWAQRSPKAAADWVATLPVGLVSEAAMAAALEAWANIDPAAAGSWVEALPAGEKRDIAMEKLGSEWAEQHPDECAVWVAQRVRAGEPAPEPLLADVANKRGDLNQEAAADWALTLPEGEARDQAAAAVGAKWATIDPQAAAAWVSGIQDAGLRTDVSVDIAGTWATIDPAGAVAWAHTLEEESMRREVTDSAYRNWALADPDRLSQWVGDHGDDSEADVARWHLADARMRGDQPEDGMAVAASITNAERRLARQQAMFFQWMKQDRGSAQQWLSAAALDRAAREALEQIAAGRKR